MIKAAMNTFPVKCFLGAHVAKKRDIKVLSGSMAEFCLLKGMWVTQNCIVNNLARHHVLSMSKTVCVSSHFSCL